MSGGSPPSPGCLRDQREPLGSLAPHIQPRRSGPHLRGTDGPDSRRRRGSGLVCSRRTRSPVPSTPALDGSTTARFRASPCRAAPGATRRRQPPYAMTRGLARSCASRARSTSAESLVPARSGADSCPGAASPSEGKAPALLTHGPSGHSYQRVGTFLRPTEPLSRCVWRGPADGPRARG